MVALKTNRIDEYIHKGWGHMHWYENTERLFAELFGADRVPLIAKLFAATSINTSLKSNVTLFRKALYEIERNLPVGDYLPNIQQQLIRVRLGEELTGQKIRAFAAAMSGDVNAVVVDIWLLRAFGIDRQYARKYSSDSTRLRSSGATRAQFAAVESWVRNRSVMLGIEPRQLSAIIWAGVRMVHSGDRQVTYDEVLRHQLYNMFETV